MRTTARLRISFALLGIFFFATLSFAERQKMGPLAAERASRAVGTSRVIISAADATQLPEVAAAIERGGGTRGRALPIIDAYVADMPNPSLAGLANNPAISHIALDRFAGSTMERTGATIGATAVREAFGYDGTGIGIAVIDSGITAWHDDLTGGGSRQRVDAFVDFVNGGTSAYDDYGHGTHVAGIIAGNGMDSNGARSGIAPNAHLIVLKVIDASGRGYISDVIDALHYVLTYKSRLNIRVVNMSVAAGVYESSDDDPLTRAAQKVVRAGVVVVAAGGNIGRDQQGRIVYGAVTAPGNAPWVLTVGASSHMGTIDRSDDRMAEFSSRGPTPFDLDAKPDLVAPGVGIDSLSDPLSTFYTTQAQYLLEGTVPTTYLPYLSQSGTSMSAPVVSGTVALMLQANPSLTPNAVKAILQYTAQVYPGHDPLTEGAGFLNAKGAVDLALDMAAGTQTFSPEWSGRMIWGNRRVTGGRPTSGANAWNADVTWGSSTTPSGQPIQFGVSCTTPACDNSQTAWTLDPSFRNVVWGSRCGNSNCVGPWVIDVVTARVDDTLVWVSSGDDTVVWGTSGDDTVVWGTSGDDTVVWGTSGDDTVVWGTSGDDTVVWGTSGDDTVVWGTSCTDPSCVPVIWNR
jgi:serine protease AprX